MIKKIVVTGGSGRFGNILKKVNNNFNLYFPKKSKLNIENYKSIEKYLKKIKPNYFVHCAALSRPMDIHDLNIVKSINTNIIGTCNVVKACEKFNIKLIYFSTNYVYPKKKGLYKETDPVFPFNNYGWSKLGGEASVQMYRNSLIIRANISQSPFLHNKAFSNVKINFLYHDEAAKIIFKLLNKKGIINLGGKSSSVYKFAKKTNSKVKKLFLKNNKYPRKLTMNLKKLNKLLKV